MLRFYNQTLAGFKLYSQVVITSFVPTVLIIPDPTPAIILATYSTWAHLAKIIKIQGTKMKTGDVSSVRSVQIEHHPGCFVL